ncbi:hypothetical protein MKW94_010552, partial [Papaver nudicaule]|nr:hypothetical protein [Papaver nudicaule]
GLLHELEVEYAQAKEEFYPLQLQYVYAQRNRSMMLYDLHVVYGTHIKMPVEIREWIKWMLLDEHLEDALEIADAREEELKKQATDEGVQLAEPIIKPERPELLNLGNNLDLVKERCS